ncbi:MAG: hypothetical protein VXW65_02535 [Pseudomonadota bacterium]|nr:hypothetical protein [Pseudomonadota bacterium]
MQQTSRRWVQIGMLSMALSVGMTAQADVIDWLGIEQRPNLEGLKKVYAGAGLSNAFINTYAESPTPYGNVYAKVGQFYDGNGLAGQLGWRYPYAYTGVDRNGYYLGGFVGHVEADSFDGDDYNRLGAGLELSYIWMNAVRAGSVSMAVAAGEEKTDSRGTKRRATPMVLFSFTFGLGVL